MLNDAVQDLPAHCNGTAQAHEQKLLVAGELFDQLNIQYENVYGENPGLIKTVAKVIGALQPGARVLDVGCGTGKPVASMLAGAGMVVHGVDASKEMVHLAQANVRGSFTNADMLDFSPPGTFDAVLFVFSLYLQPYAQVRTILRKYLACLKPGGTLLLATSGGEHFEPDASRFDPVWGYVDSVDKVFMGRRCLNSFITTDGWRKLLEDMGLTITSSETVWFMPKEQPAEPDLFIVTRKSG